MLNGFAADAACGQSYQTTTAHSGSPSTQASSSVSTAHGTFPTPHLTALTEPGARRDAAAPSQYAWNPKPGEAMAGSAKEQRLNDVYRT